MKNVVIVKISLNFIHEQSPFTVDWSKIKIETCRDTILAKVLNAVKTGEWNSDFSNKLELKSYNNNNNKDYLFDDQPVSDYLFQIHIMYDVVFLAFECDH